MAAPCASTPRTSTSTTGCTSRSCACCRAARGRRRDRRGARTRPRRSGTAPRRTQMLVTMFISSRFIATRWSKAPSISASVAPNRRRSFLRVWCRTNSHAGWRSASYEIDQCAKRSRHSIALPIPSKNSRAVSSSSSCATICCRTGRCAAVVVIGSSTACSSGSYTSLRCPPKKANSATEIASSIRSTNSDRYRPRTSATKSPARS